jgi:peptidoglycan-associated lipoprotein
MCIAALALGGCAHEHAQQTQAAQAPPPALAYTITKKAPASCPLAAQQNAPVMDVVPGQPPVQERQPVAGHVEAPVPGGQVTVKQGTASSLTFTCAGKEKTAALGASCCRARVHFATDSSKIVDEAKPVLERTANCLRDSKMAITIAGNADERGTQAYNQKLGQRRADAVASFLKDKGVKESQMTVISHGQDRPICDQHSDLRCQADNRRTDIMPAGAASPGRASAE